jgi:hypothetical protein
MTRKLWTVIGAVVTVLVLAAAGFAQDGYTPQAERALGERWEAMADYYLGTQAAYPPEALKALGARYEAMAEHYYATAPQYPPAALQALGERYETMAQYYSGQELLEAQAQASAFDWSDAGIGALIAVGLVAATGVLVVEVWRHTRHHPPGTPHAA